MRKYRPLSINSLNKSPVKINLSVKKIKSSLTLDDNVVHKTGTKESSDVKVIKSSIWESEAAETLELETFTDDEAVNKKIVSSNGEAGNDLKDFNGSLPLHCLTADNDLTASKSSLIQTLTSTTSEPLQDICLQEIEKRMKEIHGICLDHMTASYELDSSFTSTRQSVNDIHFLQMQKFDYSKPKITRQSQNLKAVRNKCKLLSNHLNRTYNVEARIFKKSCDLTSIEPKQSLLLDLDAENNFLGSYQLDKHSNESQSPFQNLIQISDLKISDVHEGLKDRLSQQSLNLTYEDIFSNVKDWFQDDYYFQSQETFQKYGNEGNQTYVAPLVCLIPEMGFETQNTSLALSSMSLVNDILTSNCASIKLRQSLLFDLNGENNFLCSYRLNKNTDEFQSHFQDLIQLSNLKISEVFDSLNDHVLQPSLNLTYEDIFSDVQNWFQEDYGFQSQEIFQKCIKANNENNQTNVALLSYLLPQMNIETQNTLTLSSTSLFNDIFNSNDRFDDSETNRTFHSYGDISLLNNFKHENFKPENILIFNLESRDISSINSTSDIKSSSQNFLNKQMVHFSEQCQDLKFSITESNLSHTTSPESSYNLSKNSFPEEERTMLEAKVVLIKDIAKQLVQNIIEKEQVLKTKKAFGQNDEINSYLSTSKDVSITTWLSSCKHKSVEENTGNLNKGEIVKLLYGNCKMHSLSQQEVNYKENSSKYKNVSDTNLLSFDIALNQSKDVSQLSKKDNVIHISDQTPYKMDTLFHDLSMQNIPKDFPNEQNFNVEEINVKESISSYLSEKDFKNILLPLDVPLKPLNMTTLLLSNSQDSIMSHSCITQHASQQNEYSFTTSNEDTLNNLSLTCETKNFNSNYYEKLPEKGHSTDFHLNFGVLYNNMQPLNDSEKFSCITISDVILTHESNKSSTNTKMHHLTNDLPKSISKSASDSSLYKRPNLPWNINKKREILESNQILTENCRTKETRQKSIPLEQWKPPNDDQTVIETNNNDEYNCIQDFSEKSSELMLTTNQEPISKSAETSMRINYALTDLLADIFSSKSGENITPFPFHLQQDVISVENSQKSTTFSNSSGGEEKPNQSMSPHYGLENSLTEDKFYSTNLTDERQKLLYDLSSLSDDSSDNSIFLHNIFSSLNNKGSTEDVFPSILKYQSVYDSIHTSFPSESIHSTENEHLPPLQALRICKSNHDLNLIHPSPCILQKLISKSQNDLTSNNNSFHRVRSDSILDYKYSKKLRSATTDLRTQCSNVTVVPETSTGKSSIMVIKLEQISGKETHRGQDFLGENIGILEQSCMVGDSSQKYSAKNDSNSESELLIWWKKLCNLKSDHEIISIPPETSKQYDEAIPQECKDLVAIPFSGFQTPSSCICSDPVISSNGFQTASLCTCNDPVISTSDFQTHPLDTCDGTVISNDSQTRSFHVCGDPVTLSSDFQTQPVCICDNQIISSGSQTHSLHVCGDTVTSLVGSQAYSLDVYDSSMTASHNSYTHALDKYDFSPFSSRSQSYSLDECDSLMILASTSQTHTLDKSDPSMSSSMNFQFHPINACHNSIASSNNFQIHTLDKCYHSMSSSRDIQSHSLDQALSNSSKIHHLDICDSSVTLSKDSQTHLFKKCDSSMVSFQIHLLNTCDRSMALSRDHQTHLNVCDSSTSSRESQTNPLDVCDSSMTSSMDSQLHLDICELSKDLSSHDPFIMTSRDSQSHPLSVGRSTMVSSSTPQIHILDDCDPSVTSSRYSPTHNPNMTSFRDSKTHLLDVCDASITLSRDSQTPSKDSQTHVCDPSMISVRDFQPHLLDICGPSMASSRDSQIHLLDVCNDPSIASYSDSFTASSTDSQVHLSDVSDSFSFKDEQVHILDIYDPFISLSKVPQTHLLDDCEPSMISSRDSQTQTYDPSMPSFRNSHSLNAYDSTVTLSSVHQAKTLDVYDSPRYSQFYFVGASDPPVTSCVSQVHAIDGVNSSAIPSIGFQTHPQVAQDLLMVSSNNPQVHSVHACDHPIASSSDSKVYILQEYNYPEISFSQFQTHSGECNHAVVLPRISQGHPLDECIVGPKNYKEIIPNHISKSSASNSILFASGDVFPKMVQNKISKNSSKNKLNFNPHAQTEIQSETEHDPSSSSVCSLKKEFYLQNKQLGESLKQMVIPPTSVFPLMSDNCSAKSQNESHLISDATLNEAKITSLSELFLSLSTEDETCNSFPWDEDDDYEKLMVDELLSFSPTDDKISSFSDQLVNSKKGCCRSHNSI